MDADAVAAGVEELARVLRADGGDLRLVEADAQTLRIRLEVVLDGVSCDDCVLPPDLLFETIEASLRRRVPGEFELLVDDPRRHSPDP
jgi:Fe-S cluster biogenesis protein NfuA